MIFVNHLRASWSLRGGMCHVTESDVMLKLIKFFTEYLIVFPVKNQSAHVL